MTSTELPTPELLLLDKIDAFVARTHIAASDFGELACNDRRFVSDLRAGERELRRSTIEKVEKWMAGFDAGLDHARQRSCEVAA